MAAHLLNDLLIPQRMLNHIEKLVGNVAMQSQFAPCRAVDRFCMRGLQHNQRDRVGAEDFEVFRRE